MEKKSYFYHIKNEILHFATDFNGVWFLCKVQYIKYIKSMKASINMKKKIQYIDVKNVGRSGYKLREFFNYFSCYQRLFMYVE